MSTTADVPPPDAFEPVLPIEPRPYRSIGRRLIGPVCLVIVVAGLCLIWFSVHGHMMAMATISLRGGSVRWDLSEGRWKDGGESSVSFGPQGWSTKDDAIAPLADLNHVVSLDLADCSRISLSSYDVLKRLPDLQFLYLSRAPEPFTSPIVLLDDAVLPNIAGHPRLVELYLDGNPITDKGLASLTGLPRLEVIDLSRTAVTDAGLKHLLSLPNLKTIQVEGTGVTAEGIDAFVRRRPEVEILQTDPKSNVY
jgi:hypothetical protein